MINPGGKVTKVLGGEGRQRQHTFSFPAASAAWRPNCVGIPSTRWVELMFLTLVI